MLIFASVSPSTTIGQLRRIIISGPDALRFNFYYFSLEDNIKYFNLARDIAEELNSPVKELFDFPMNKIKLGAFDAGIFTVKENDELIFQTAPHSPDCNKFVPIDFPRIGERVSINQTITLGNGRISLQVMEVKDLNTIVMKVCNDGFIKTQQSFNNGTTVEEKEMIDLYENIFKAIEELRPDYIALSYLSENFITQIKNFPIVENIKKHTKIVIKIEKEITNAEIEKICQDTFFNMILIDRGEMAVNMPFEKIGIFQKNITNYANKYGKKFLVSTQILSSTTNNFIPSRSDINDLTNIILDEAYGIILSKETSAGQKPVYTISTAKKIINEVEKYKDIYHTKV